MERSTDDRYRQRRRDDETRDVKVSRSMWSQDHFFGLDLGLSLVKF